MNAQIQKRQRIKEEMKLTAERINLEEIQIE